MSMDIFKASLSQCICIIALNCIAALKFDHME